MKSIFKSLSINLVNPNIVKMGFVTDPLFEHACLIEKKLKQGIKKPFDEIIWTSFGDSHSMEQPYNTFLRSVLALVIDPTNFNSLKYPEDAKQRARDILSGCGGGSIGSYSDSAGIEVIRRHAAEYIQNRDGIPSRWEDVYLGAGASQSIHTVMNLFNRRINGKVPGIMIPIPQYPLYSATIAEFGMQQISYYLDEETNWGLNMLELERSVDEAKKHCVPRAIVIINPGNPTGQVLTRDNITNIIKFAHDHKLFIFADEVYQDNVYEKESTFHSFKKVLFEMGAPYNQMELASFMSCSKGYMGECGIRGGYVELVNLEPNVKAMYQKLISAQLCPTTVGQAAIDVVVNPPKKGEPSYEQWYKEKTTILNSLKERAKLLTNGLKLFDGVFCNTVQGAMYAFPRIELPPKAIEAAKQAGQPADVFYATALLEEAGICVLPGSGFGQKAGTYHFRTTILPKIDKLKIMLNRFEIFHNRFMTKYKSTPSR